MLRRPLEHIHRNRRAAAVCLGLALALFVAMPASADFETGYQAYKARDYQRAYDELRPLAEAGDAKAQEIFEPARRILAGGRDAVHAAVQIDDLQTAKKLLLPMAETGDEWALWYLRIVEDRSVRKAKHQRRMDRLPPLERGIYQYKRRIHRLRVDRLRAASTLIAPFAEAGNARALYYLGLVTLDASGGPEDEEEAWGYIEQAAKKGYPDAQHRLAVSIGRTEDYRAPMRSFGWLIAAAGRNSHDSYLMLASYYCLVPDVLPNDPVLANAWLALTFPDIAMGKPAEALESNWEQVKSHWETFGCGQPTNVTPDFVRDIHRRAQALITAFDIQPCSYERKCDDVVSKWQPDDASAAGADDTSAKN